jgi:hypothetical protein
MHGTGALFERDVVGEHTQRVTVEQRMTEADAVELRPLHPDDRRTEGPAGSFRHFRRERLGHDHRAAIHVVRGVVEVGMERDRKVGGNRPRCCRPDQDRHGPAGELRHSRHELSVRVVRERKLDVDRRRRVVGVLDFGFRKRGPAMDAPVDGLLPLVDEPPLHEPPERAGNRGLVPEIHRQVQVRPVAEHTQPLELDAHHVDVAGRIVPAGAPEVGDGHVALLRTQLAIHFELDRQPVAVVPQDVRRIEAHHRPRFDDDVLEDFVHGRAEMDPPVGVGRTVVQHELRAAGALLANTLVEPHLLPAGERLRLGRLKVRLHGEVCVRQVQRVFPLGHGSFLVYKQIKKGRPP